MREDYADNRFAGQSAAKYMCVSRILAEEVDTSFSIVHARLRHRVAEHGFLGPFN